ncbi:MAG: diaminopimelate decarboxylase [Bryobacterales bacterium]|nr:diaminopimelate decarboxylase [Bryobacterales bacterium]
MPNPFEYRDAVLYCEDVELTKIAEQAGTPCYVYSAGAILSRYRAYDDGLAGLPHRVCYAVKANSNLSVLRLLAQAGAGFDIVSGGELYRVLQAGGDPASVVFSGVGKTRAEIDYALEQGIHNFNCESEAEIALISSLATRLGKTASIAIRVNPDVDAATHPYISTGLKEHKFGIDIAEVESVYQRAATLPGISLDGVSCHIGSQLLAAAPLVEAARKLLALVGRLRAAGIAITELDLGGGLGVPYSPADDKPNIAAFLADIRTLVAGAGLFLLFEPGRSIVAEAGALLSRVLYRKKNGEKEFIIIDASMSELIRPALYDAHHEILPLRQSKFGTVKADVVGPVCESGDFLAVDRTVANVLPGDMVAAMTAGAYGFAMASNYNARPRPCEVLVEGATWRIVRTRETYADLTRGE